MSTKQCNDCGEEKPFEAFYAKTSLRETKYENTPAGYSYQCKECDKKARRLYVLANPDKSKASDRGYHLSRYGLTVSDYNKLFEDQKGCCKGCGKHQMELKKRLCVDHDRATGEVRGLLCIPCNLILGYAQDKVNVLSNLINYLNVSESAGASSKTDTKVG